MLLGGCERQAAAMGGPQMYFVPGGRIGFNKPDEISVLNNSWILLSPPHTLMVQVRETVRLGPDYDDYMWDKDERSERILPDPILLGFECRRFRDRRYDPSRDYAAETVVVRDATWMGEVQVDTSDHGGLIKSPEGQIARWRVVTDTVLNTISVRPRLTIADALAELHMNLDTSGLNPRFIGEELILSLYTPRTAAEVLGANHSTISLRLIALRPLGPKDEWVKAIDEEIEMRRQLWPDARVISGLHCRGLIESERDYIPGHFTTKILAFGHTRHKSIEASYTAVDRAPVLDALHRVFQSLSLEDFP